MIQTISFIDCWWVFKGEVNKNASFLKWWIKWFKSLTSVKKHLWHGCALILQYEFVSSFENGNVNATWIFWIMFSLRIYRKICHKIEIHHQLLKPHHVCGKFYDVCLWESRPNCKRETWRPFEICITYFGQLLYFWTISFPLRINICPLYWF